MYKEVKYMAFISDFQIKDEYVPDLLDLISTGVCPICRKTTLPAKLPYAGASRHYVCSECEADVTIDAWEASFFAD